MTAELGIGDRIAWYRRRRGIPQEALAGLVGRTADWLSKVENNRIALDRLSVIRNLADALGVQLHDLLGDQAAVGHRRADLADALASVRESLTDYRTVSPLLRRPADEAPIDLNTLGTRLRTAWDATQDARYSTIAPGLAKLLADAHHAAKEHSGDEQLRAYALLAMVHQLTATVLTRTGEAELAWIAADRGLSAAHLSGDEFVIGSLFRSVAHCLLGSGRLTAAQDLVTDAACYLRNADGLNSPAGLSVYGTLLFVGSMAAARSGDRIGVRGWLAESSQAAERLGTDANHLWTAFGPTNVAIHRVSTAMELGDLQVALDIGPQIDVSSLPVERQVRHRLELARAHHARHEVNAAVQILLDAERLAPDQVRHHFIPQKLVATWIRAQRGRPRPELAGLAQRLKIVE
ncbi:helix-turn-helix domain-containing protein [Kitasatospora sp. NPDC001175]|uniref:helix-turn-helix domain-containing protein n=1 Tax=Kitasatospora sp. NPDC001175 TaxID=3157103 RepID=UPI003D067E9D